MLEDKLELERSFGVESVPVGKPEAEPPATEEALVGKPPVAQPEEVAPAAPSPLEGEGRGEGDQSSPLPAGEGQGEGDQPKEARPRPVGAVAHASKAEQLASLEQQMLKCHQCSLGATRTNLVFGDGSADADLMFIGEAPGQEEDAQGLPFVGRAGKLLDKVIEAMGLKRSDVYIGNILKCRPPGNRNPRPSEVAPCLPHLRRQIAIIAPKVIVCLGGVAAQTLLETSAPVGRLRGTFHDYEGIPLLVTYHTAYLLRNPAGKADVWEDMKKVLHKLGLPIPEK